MDKINQSIWSGAFAPVSKHRDYAHGSWFEHELANGGSYQNSPDKIYTGNNPIDNDLYSPSEEYYIVDFVTSHGESYPYLVPAEPDNSEPNPKRIRTTLEEYVKNPVEGGRDMNDYIDFDKGIPLSVIEWMVERGHEDLMDFRWAQSAQAAT